MGLEELKAFDGVKGRGNKTPKMYLDDYKKALDNAADLVGEDEIMPSGNVVTKSIVMQGKVNGLPVLIWPIVTADGVDTGAYKIAWNGL